MNNLVFLFTLLLIFFTQAKAATTGILNLVGVVPEILSIQVNAETEASTLDLEVDQTALQVATVLEKSNSNTGYSITVTSLNGALLRDGGSETVVYTATYDGDPVNLGTGSTFNRVASNAVANVSSFNISYTGVSHEDRVAGTYRDTVTFTITAN